MSQTFSKKKLLLKMEGKCLKMSYPREDEPAGMEDESFEVEPWPPYRYSVKYRISPYDRSAAGNETNPEKIRPLHVLIKTLEHIRENVILKLPNTKKRTDKNLSDFLRNRFRAMGKDINVQHLEGEEVMNLYENFIVFLIWSGVRHCNLPKGDYDHDVYREIIRKFLLSLTEQFQNFDKCSHRHAPNESKFYALFLSTFITEEDFFSIMYNIPEDIVSHGKYFNEIILLHSAFQRTAVSEFLIILRRLPLILQSSILLFSKKLWFNSMKNLKKLFYKESKNGNAKSFSSDYISYLGIPDFQKEKWLNEFKIEEEEGKKELRFTASEDPKSDFNLPTIYPEFLPSIEEIKLHNTKKDFLFTEFFQFVDQLDASESFSQPEPESQKIISESIQEDFSEPNIVPLPVYDEVQPENLSSSFQPIPEEKSASPFIPSKTTSPIPKMTKVNFSPMNTEKSQEPKNSTFIKNPEVRRNEKYLIPPTLNLNGLIPQSFIINPKCDAFASILVFANDDSDSALFALNRLSFQNIQKPQKILKSFSRGSANFYLLIQVIPHDLLSNPEIISSLVGVGSILNCEDSFDANKLSSNLYADLYPNQFSYNVKPLPIISFSTYDSLSVFLSFDNALREAIENAVEIFDDFDLGHFLIELFEALFSKISTAAWLWATAQSVIDAINSILDSLALFIMSPIFLQYVLPQEFGLMEMDQLKEFSDYVKSMKLQSLDSIFEYRLPQPGLSWVSKIQSSILLPNVSFIIPIKKSFDKVGFLKLILQEVPVQPYHKVPM